MFLGHEDECKITPKKKKKKEGTTCINPIEHVNKQWVTLQI